MENTQTQLTTPKIARAKAYPGSVPKVSADVAKAPDEHATFGKAHNFFMMACCVAMVAGVGILVATAPATQSWSATLWTAFPLLACVGAHLVMHKFMGKSCHGSDATTKDEGTVK